MSPVCAETCWGGQARCQRVRRLLRLSEAQGVGRRESITLLAVSNGDQISRVGARPARASGGGRASFGGVPLSDVTPRVVETFYEDLKGRSGGEGDEARPLAVATVNRYMKLLHAVLRLGVKRGLLLTNPVASVDLASENNARVRCLSPTPTASTSSTPGAGRPRA